MLFQLQREMAHRVIVRRAARLMQMWCRKLGVWADFKYARHGTDR